MKNTFLLIIVLLSGFLINAQKTITPEMLNDFSTGFKSDKSAKALQNAISSNNIKKLAVNRENLGKVDTYFKYKVKTSGITNQKSSGRCWLFTGLNVLRPVADKNLNVSGFKFSQSFVFFYDQLEKANLFLEGIIDTRDKLLDDKRVEWLLKNPIGDGGQWTGLVDLVTKYGVVPDDVMPESYNAENTGMMSRLLSRNLKADALKIREMAASGKSEKEIRKAKKQMLADVYRVLALTLGEPPATFRWRYKDKDGNLTDYVEYTPKSFYDKWIGLDLHAYVMFMNDPSRPFYKLYEIDYDRHMYEGGNWKYINLPADEIKVFALESVKDNQAMYFSCDVGKQMDIDRGYLDVNNYDYSGLFSVNFDMNKTQRIQTFASGSTHGMTLVGADVDKDGKTTKWLLENSWGMKGYKGHLIMTDQWFDEYMFRLVIDKKYISEKVLKILDSEPVMLPPWDPMFSMEL
jgi:bleomycin hydrolase